MQQAQNVESIIYDVLSPLYEDISTDSLQYVEYYDANLNDANAVNEFRIEVKEREQWFLPAKAYMAVRYRLVAKTDGATIATTVNAAPQSNAVGLFKRWELLFDDNIAEYVDFAGIQNTIQSLIYFSHDDLAIAAQQHFFKDTVSNAASNSAAELEIGGAADTSTIAGIRSVNQGRLSLFDQSANANSVGAVGTNHGYMTAIIPLKNVFGVLKSMTHVTKGLKLSLRLDVESADNCVTAPGPANIQAKIQFARVSLWIPRVKPNVSVLSKLETMLAQEAIHQVPFVDTQCFRSNQLTQSTLEQIYQIKTRRRRPVKVFVAMQRADRVAPTIANTQLKSRRIFDNLGVTSMRVVLNANVQYPEREYSSAFATESDYGRIYAEYLRAGLKDHSVSDGPAIGYQEFKNLFTIYCIDMSEQMEYQVVPDSALVDVYWKTAVDPLGAANYFAWFVVESERKLELATGDGVIKYIGVN
jgi:hypothetical protein